MEIYLLRHGETAGDIQNRYGGRYDDDLTWKGVKQAEVLAQSLLKGANIQAIVSSPYLRARRTAGIISGELFGKANTATRLAPNLREQDRYGELSGMRKSDALRTYPDLAAILEDPKRSLGEPYGQFKTRVIGGLQAIAEDWWFAPLDRIAIVTHGGPIKVIYREILKLGEVDVADCGLAVVRFDQGRYTLVKSWDIKAKA